ncbi:MAG: hypothetical protein KA135_09995, partial [Halioglobus sp.]|nr:hypothetical protein [Halioglobus sp.]
NSRCPLLPVAPSNSIFTSSPKPLLFNRYAGYMSGAIRNSSVQLFSLCVLTATGILASADPAPAQLHWRSAALQ